MFSLDDMCSNSPPKETPKVPACDEALAITVLVQPGDGVGTCIAEANGLTMGVLKIVNPKKVWFITING